jgi:hypothetical protein
MKVVILLFLLTVNVLALEIDEKLTLRIVGTSETRKTILVNRGTEDGLVKGDHAKFYLSIGVVARGVCIKVSPGRSVWSMYRLVNADYIKKDEVMKLKITAPVKITKDESRTLVADDTASNLSTSDPRDLGIPLADGANDLKDSQTNMANKATSMMSEAEIYSTSLREKNKELFGSFHYSSKSSEATNNSSSDTFSATETNLLFDVGLEYYFKDESKWYSRISFLGIFRMMRTSVQSAEGTVAGENSSYFGAGVNWYPLTRPSKVYKFIPFGHFAYYLGSTSSEFKPGDSINATVNTENTPGSFSSIVLGGGFKYFLHNSYGAFARLDYEFRADEFAEDSIGQQRNKGSVGPRIFTGLLYRF